MSLWIKRDVLLPRNRKTYRLAELLSQGGTDLFGGRDEIAWRAIAMALLEQFWAHVAEHYPKGDVTAAPTAELRDAVRPWLDGTSWVCRDVRELLVQSGHVQRTRSDRYRIHDWLEWTGSDMVRLATDRKRKRVARAKYPADWERISREVRANAGHRCQCTGQCGTEHRHGVCNRRQRGRRMSGDRVVIETAHLDHNPANSNPENLLAMCHQCHVRYDSSENGPRNVRRRVRGRPTLAEQREAEQREESKDSQRQNRRPVVAERDATT